MADPASNTTTLYGQIPNKVIAFPYYTVASAASTVATSSSFGATQVALLNKVSDTFVALGYWATS